MITANRALFHELAETADRRKSIEAQSQIASFFAAFCRDEKKKLGSFESKLPSSISLRNRHVHGVTLMSRVAPLLDSVPSVAANEIVFVEASGVPTNWYFTDCRAAR